MTKAAGKDGSNPGFFPTDKAALEKELYAAAEAGVEKGLRPRGNAKDGVRSLKVIYAVRCNELQGMADVDAEIEKGAAQLRHGMDAAGVDRGFVAVGRDVALKVEKAPSGRKKKLAALTSEEIETTAAIAGRVARGKRAVARAARSMQHLELAETFGRGSSFDHRDPVDVSSAVESFIGGARTQVEVLQRARIPQAETIARFETDRQRLEGIIQLRSLRETVVAPAAPANHLDELALESWIDRYGAQVTWHVEDEALAGRLLGLLPRAPERRRRAAPDAPQPPQPEKK